MKKIKLKKLTKKLPKLMQHGILLIILVFIYGIVGSYYIMGLNLIDSIYYSIITMATVGYGDYLPQTGLQKIFAITLALGGVVLLAYLFNIILTSFQESMSKYSKERRKMRKIKGMDSYYVLCGYGRVGKVVYSELRQRNHNVIIFEKNPEKTENLEESDHTVIIIKDATEDELIAELSGEKCQSVIISTGDDVTNLFVVLTIRETNPDAWIVTRASKLDNISRLRRAGADKIVSPEVSGGKDLYHESARPHLLRLTVQHSPDEILNEFETIVEHECTLENIDYHIPGIETPLSRDIKTRNFNEGKEYIDNLKAHEDDKVALDNLYKSVNNIHSHWISGPNEKTFEILIEEMEKEVTIIGKNLTNKEIAEITKKKKREYDSLE